LYKSAKIVFSRYGHPYAFEDALIGKYDGDPDLTVACGDPWTPPLCEESSAILSNERRKTEVKRKGKEKRGVSKATLDNESSPIFLGDQTLAQSCQFLYDATVSRELVYATADGDVGRVWEIIKVSLVYLGYLKVLSVDWKKKGDGSHICWINTYKVHELPSGDDLRP